MHESESDFTLSLMQSKIDVQNELITLMQTEIDMQNEKITSQGEQVKYLTSKLEKVEELVLNLISEKCDSTPIEPSNTNTTSIQKIDSANPVNSTTDHHQVASDTTSSSSRCPPVPSVPIVSIAEMARETAEAFAVTSGFIYDENTGLYYDYSSGYYYDSNRKLYYNGHTRTYYSFDDNTKEYVFHSQLPTPEVGTANKVKRKTKVLKHRSTQTKSISSKRLDKTRIAGHNSKEDEDDIEEGELSSSDGEQDIASDSDKSISIIERPPRVHEVIDVESGSDAEEKENPPCIRAIVKKSEGTSPKLQKGSLHIVTCMGGTIGREGENHAIVIPDPNVSQIHAKITYGYDEVSAIEIDGKTNEQVRLQKKYFIMDLGSQNGTFLNRKRLSDSNIQSELFEIQHGSTLQIMDTQLLLHIHSGNKTCGHCEPGLLLEKEVEILNGPVVLTQAQKESQRKKTLRKIRQKYSIGNLQTGIIPKLVEKYKDRAEDRRRLQGSVHEAFKLPETEPASIHVPISKQNKGFKMLQKMGWSEGESLGQAGESSLREPVKFEVKVNRAGLGSNYSGGVFDKRDKRKASYRNKTAQRYFAASRQKLPLSMTTTTTTLQNTKREQRLDVIELD